MRVRTLHLRNYRRFRAVDLELPDGLIAIVGPNGAGKSTLIEAVAWCLFGHEASRTDKDLVRHQGAAPGDDVEVRLEFELDQGRYAVMRRLRGKSQQAEAQVEADGVLVVAPGANSADLATKYAGQLLGMDRRGFLSTVVANQGDLQALGDAKPGERKRLILSLLGIDDVEAAVTRARTKKREATLRLDETRRFLARAQDLEARLGSWKAEAAKAHADLQRSEEESTKQRLRLDALEGEAQRLMAARQRNRDIRTRLEGLQRTITLLDEQRSRGRAEVELLEEKAADLDQARRSFAHFADLEQRLTEWERVRASLVQRDQLVAARTRVDQEAARWQDVLGSNGHHDEEGERELVELRREADALAQDLARDEAQRNQLGLDAQRMTDAREALSARREHLALLGAHAPCPLCERPLGDALRALDGRLQAEESSSAASTARAKELRATLERRLTARRQEATALRARLQAQERVVGEARAAAQRRQMAATEAGRLARQRIEIETQLATLAAPSTSITDDLSKQRIERDALRERIARLETDATRLQRLRSELSAAAGRHEATRADVEAASRDLAQFPYAEGTAEAAERATSAARLTFHEGERTRAVLAERVARLGDQVVQAQTDLAGLDALRREAADLEAQVRIGEVLAADRGDAGLLPEFKAHLISRVRPVLARSAGLLIAEMTKGRYTELAIDEDYGLRLYDRGSPWPLERFSGGEKDVVHLAVRLAVSELLAKARRARRLQFVALDEVLASQDEGRRLNVLGALESLLPNFRQVLLVTHLDELRERVDHVIRIVPSSDGTSRLVASWTQNV